MEREFLKSLGYSEEYINHIENYKKTQDLSIVFEKNNFVVSNNIASDSISLFVNEDPKTSITNLQINI